MGVKIYTGEAGAQLLLDGIDGELGKRVVGGIELHLADGLQTAGLILNLHVVEGRVNNVNATKWKNIIDRHGNILSS